jgi:hypothetical protein
MTLALSEGLSRAALTAGVLAVWAVGVWAMWRGWRRRAERTALPALPAPPELPGPDLVPRLAGVYLGTTLAGHWLERVTGQRLADRTSGWLRVLPSGVLLRRPGSEDLFLPRDSLRSVRTDSAHSGKVIVSGGVVVIGWEHGGVALETGFRGDDRGRHREIAQAVEGLIQVPVADTTAATRETS